jgi:hypothetical protein
MLDVLLGSQGKAGYFADISARNPARPCTSTAASHSPDGPPDRIAEET